MCSRKRDMGLRYMYISKTVISAYVMTHKAEVKLVAWCMKMADSKRDLDACVKVAARSTHFVSEHMHQNCTLRRFDTLSL